MTFEFWLSTTIRKIRGNISRQSRHKYPLRAETSNLKTWTPQTETHGPLMTSWITPTTNKISRSQRHYLRHAEVKLKTGYQQAPADVIGVRNVLLYCLTFSLNDCTCTSHSRLLYDHVFFPLLWILRAHTRIEQDFGIVCASNGHTLFSQGPWAKIVTIDITVCMKEELPETPRIAKCFLKPQEGRKCSPISKAF